MKITESMRAEARDYYRLIAAAQAVGIPTDLSDPHTPLTVERLRAAVAVAGNQA